MMTLKVYSKLLNVHHLPDPSDGHDDLPQPGPVPRPFPLLAIAMSMVGPLLLCSLYLPPCTLWQMESKPLTVRREEDEQHDQHHLPPVHGGVSNLSPQVRVSLLHGCDQTPARWEHLPIAGDAVRHLAVSTRHQHCAEVGSQGDNVGGQEDGLVMQARQAGGQLGRWVDMRRAA